MTNKTYAEKLLEEVGGEAGLEALFQQSIQNAMDKLSGKHVPQPHTMTRDQGFDTLPAPDLYIGLRKKDRSPQ